MAVPYALLGTFFDSILGMGDRKNQLALQQAQLNETRRSSREAEKMAKASRTDAQGNKTYFDGEGFQVELAPMIRAIMEAGNREQLATLREDAPRARAASVRKDDRSRGASDAYDRAFAEMEYAPQKGEGVFQAEDFLNALEGSQGDNYTSLIDAVRSGLPSALKTAQKAAQGNRPSLTALKRLTDRSGTAAFTTDVNSSGSEMALLDQLRAVADGTDGATPLFSNVNEQMAAGQENALQGLIAAVQSGGAARAGALGNMAANSPARVKLSPLFDALNAEYGKSPEEKALEEWLLQQQTTGAQLGTANNITELMKLFQQNQGVI